MGLSFFSTLQCVNLIPDCKIDYYSIEKHLLPKSIFIEIYKNHPILKSSLNTFLEQYDPEKNKTIQNIQIGENIKLHLLAFDVLEALEKFQIKTDVWYLDGFSPTKNPAMWSSKIFEYIKAQSKKNATLATYSTSRIVKDGLENAGFILTKKKGFGSKREFLTGVKEKKFYSISEKPWFILQKNQTSGKNFTIVGAGLAGSALAYFLSKENFNITLVDQESSISNKASSNPAALFTPNISQVGSIEFQWYQEAFKEFSSFLDQIPAHLYNRTGVIQFSESISSKVKTQIRSNEIQFDFKDKNFPNTELVYFPNAGWVNPKQLCKFYTDQKNIQILLEKMVLNFKFENQLWKVFTEKNQLIAESEILIFANSHYLNQIEGISFSDLKPVRGQILQIPKTELPYSLTRSIIFEDGYLISNIEDSFILGSTFAPTEFKEETNESESELLIQRLKSIFPDLKIDLKKIKPWFGFRGITKDHLPIVGKIPNYSENEKNYSDIWKGNPYSEYPIGECFPNLFMSVGHGSKGLLNSYYSAKLLTDLILEKSSDDQEKFLQRVNPIRFQIKGLQQKQP